jgi:methyl-accepting chemotaxis protein
MIHLWNPAINIVKTDKMVTDFGSTSEELFASVQNMAKAIDEIASSTNEGAQGATDIAQDVEDIVNKSNEVINLSKSAEEKSNMLIKIVSQFRV